jgi:hypothetical protein
MEVSIHRLVKIVFCPDFFVFCVNTQENVVQITLTLSLTAPCAPLYLTALRLNCPIKIELICQRAMS